MKLYPLYWLCILSSSTLQGTASFNDVLVTPTNSIVVAGNSLDANHQQHFIVCRYTDQGIIDTSFGTNGVTQTTIGDQSSALSVQLQSDQKLIAGGYCSQGNTTQGVLVRYSDSGILDTTFGSNGIAFLTLGESCIIYHVVAQQDDMLVVSGSYMIDGTPIAFIARFTADGQLDTSFGANGIISIATQYTRTCAYSCVIQPDGNIVTTVTGNESHIALYRHLTTGKLDTTFGTNGSTHLSFENRTRASTVSVRSNGKLVVSGKTATHALIIQYNSDGTIDSTNGSYKVPFAVPNLHTTVHTLNGSTIVLALSTSKQVLLVSYNLDIPFTAQVYTPLDLAVSNTTLNAVIPLTPTSYISVGEQEGYSYILCSTTDALCTAFGNKGSIVFPSVPSTPNYFFAYTTTNYRASTTYAPIPLDASSLSVDWGHKPGDSVVTCYTAGTYVIMYTIPYQSQGIQNGTEILIRTLHNGSELRGSTSVQKMRNNRTTTLVRTFIVKTQKGDTLEWEHEKSAPQGIININGSGEQNSGATITIHRARKKLIDYE